MAGSFAFRHVSDLKIRDVNSRSKSMNIEMGKKWSVTDCKL